MDDNPQSDPALMSTSLDDVINVKLERIMSIWIAIKFLFNFWIISVQLFLYLNLSRCAKCNNTCVKCVNCLVDQLNVLCLTMTMTVTMTMAMTMTMTMTMLKT